MGNCNSGFKTYKNFKEVKVDNIRDRNIRIPGPSEEFAEFMGALAGDGHLTNSNETYRIELTLNKTEDIYYLSFLERLFRELFRVEPVIYRRDDGGNRIDIRIHSKKIHSFLSRSFPEGKKNSLEVPEWIDSVDYIIPYLRGLMDTDGSLFFTRHGTYNKHSYPVMELKMNDESFLDQIASLLDRLGIDYYRSSDIKLQLNGKSKLENWMERVGFSNPSRSSRYNVWRVQNYCPPSTNLEERLDILGLKPG